MSTFNILLMIWIITAPISYIVVRKDYKSSFGKWTRVDRLFWLSFSVLYGPIMLLVVLGAGLLCKISSSKWGQGEAKW